MTVERISDPLRGEAAQVSVLATSLHAGTHVDAPCHIPGGRGGVETLDLPALIGPALVVRCAGAPVGSRQVVRWNLPRGARVLMRGGAPLSPEGARELVRRRVRLVGTDALSVDPVASAELPAHRVLLSAGVVVLESLDLSAAPPGRYRLIALPLLIPGADGAPVRAILMRPTSLTSRARRRPRRPGRSGTTRRA